MAESIKSVALRLMRERGTAGLSLRAIAREMQITAPAIYNYFPHLEDLITALLVDAFTSIADAMEDAGKRVESDAVGPKILATILMYRQWSVEHQIESQLIYGNPIPGYEAPPEITTPLARRPFLPLIGYFIHAWQIGELSIPPAYAAIPPTIVENIVSWRRANALDVPDALFYLLMSGWSRIHGMLMLELTHHSQPLIGDVEAFYRFEVLTFLHSMGLSLPDG